MKQETFFMIKKTVPLFLVYECIINFSFILLIVNTSFKERVFKSCSYCQIIKLPYDRGGLQINFYSPLQWELNFDSIDGSIISRGENDDLKLHM